MKKLTNEEIKIVRNYIKTAIKTMGENPSQIEIIAGLNIFHKWNHKKTKRVLKLGLKNEWVIKIDTTTGGRPAKRYFI